MSTDQGFIAYFDLLGTSELAQTDRTAFFTSLVTFRNTITHCATSLHADDGVYFFSDCAFVESSDFDRLVRYLRTLRQRLMEEGYFIVGALGPGSLEATGPFPKAKRKSRTQSDREDADIRRQIVHGHFFGSAVVPVYAMQNQLKGIGFQLHPDLVPLAQQKKVVVDSCHLPANDSRVGHAFPDLRLQPSELTSGLLEKFLKYFYRAKLRSKKYARYYIAFLVSALQSTDFGGVDTKRPYTAQGYPILEVLLGTKFLKNFSDVPGIDYVYLTLLDRAYESDNQHFVNAVLKVVSGRRKAIVQLDSCPSPLLSRDNRTRLLDHLASHFSSTVQDAASGSDENAPVVLSS